VKGNFNWSTQRDRLDEILLSINETRNPLPEWNHIVDQYLFHGDLMIKWWTSKQDYQDASDRLSDTFRVTQI
jgi:hypothetical protein